MNKGLLSLALVLMSALTGSGCGTAALQGPSTMSVAINADPQHLIPLLANDQASVRAAAPLFALLYQARPDLSVEPDLAASLPSISADGRAWTIRLKPGLLWSDGVALTSSDVNYTLNVLLSPDLNAQSSHSLGPIQSVDLPDGATLVIHLAAPYAPLLAALVLPILPRHALTGIAPAALSGSDFDHRPTVSSGPYQLSERIPGDSLVMVPNPRYHLGNAHFRKLTYKVIPDPDARAAALLSHEIDWDPAVGVGSLDRLIHSSQARVYEYPGLNYFDLRFNTRQGHLFDRMEARQALAYALDKKAVVRGSGRGHTTAIYGDIPRQSWAFDPAQERDYYAQDVEGARKLLAAAGWTPGPDGIAVRNVQPPPPPADRFHRNPPAPPPTPQRFSTRLLVRAGSPVRSAAAQLIADQARVIGIELQVDVQDSATFYAPLKDGSYDVAVAGFEIGLDPDNFTVFDPSQISPQPNPAGLNWTGFASDDLHNLLLKGRQATATSAFRFPDVRRPTYGQIEFMLDQALPTYFLWSENSIQAFNPLISGVSPVTSDWFSSGRNSQVYYNWRPAGS